MITFMSHDTVLKDKGWSTSRVSIQGSIRSLFCLHCDW